jgi:hypothetical protein
VNAEGLMENSGGRGLPEKLPAGERVLWQGSPQWRTLFRHAFHGWAMAAYFGVIIAWTVASSLGGGEATGAVALTAAKLLGVALVPVGLAALYCWGVQRSTVYTVTNRRVVMSFGLALPMSVNVPFSRIETAGLRRFTSGAGDIPLRLMPGERMAYFMVWPHARPWRMAKAEPMLRCIGQVDAAAAVLSRALAAHADMPVPLRPVMAGRPAKAPGVQGQPGLGETAQAA